MQRVTRGGAGCLRQGHSNSTHISCICNGPCQVVVLVCLPPRVERHCLRHSCRALAHARANVYAPTRLGVPMLATTPPSWETMWEVVHFNRAGCVPSQDVVLPLRSMVTFALFPVLVNLCPFAPWTVVHACIFHASCNII